MAEDLWEAFRLESWLGCVNCNTMRIWRACPQACASHTYGCSFLVSMLWLQWDKHTDKVVPNIQVKRFTRTRYENDIREDKARTWDNIDWLGTMLTANVSNQTNRRLCAWIWAQTQLLVHTIPIPSLVGPRRCLRPCCQLVKTGFKSMIMHLRVCEQCNRRWRANSGSSNVLAQHSPSCGLSPSADSVAFHIALANMANWLQAFKHSLTSNILTSQTHPESCICMDMRYRAFVLESVRLRDKVLLSGPLVNPSLCSQSAVAPVCPVDTPLLNVAFVSSPILRAWCKKSDTYMVVVIVNAIIRDWSP